jgi:Fe-S-cluster containining protein|tara:strand:+ start:192 stop:593 length:402 start_codon:yes stop_codon:yes gene_type:complete
MKAEGIAEKARRSISAFCIEECKAYCCRKSYLVLTSEEVDLVTKEKRKELEEKNILKKLDGEKYILHLHNDCPSLKNNLCVIYDDQKRSTICKQFPIFIENKNIKLSSGCLAVKMNLFYPYVHELLKLGYKIS